MKKTYCIGCIIDDFYYVQKGHFDTLEEAEEALESLCNFHLPKTTTGKIYSRGLALFSKSELVLNKQFNKQFK